MAVTFLSREQTGGFHAMRSTESELPPDGDFWRFAKERAQNGVFSPHIYNDMVLWYNTMEELADAGQLIGTGPDGSHESIGGKPIRPRPTPIG